MTEDCPNLTERGISRLMNGENVDKPILRLIKLGTNRQLVDSTSDNQIETQYRLQLSDRTTNSSHFWVIKSELIRRIQNKEFNESDVIVLNDFCSNRDLQLVYINDMSQFVSGSNTTPKASTSSEPQTADNCIANENSVQTEDNIREVTTDSTDVIPINRITTDVSNNWKIRGMVTSKTKRQKWSNTNGEGYLFSFVVTDQSGEIRLNAFNSLCQKFYNCVEEKKTYRISNGIINKANKLFSNLVNDYDIHLTNDSIIEECPQTETMATHVCKPRYQFISIKDLLTKTELQSIVDVIGAVKEVEECQTIASKRRDNQILFKRDIVLLDTTGEEIRLTLWNQMAKHFNCDINTIISVKNVVLKQFNGRSLSAIPNTSFQLSPDLPEMVRIRQWLSSGEYQKHLTPGKIDDQNRTGRIRLILLCQIDEKSIHFNRNNYFYIKARVKFPLSQSPLYKSCKKSGCFKKLIELTDDKYRCTKCLEETPNFQWRLLLSALLIDCTTERWINLFDSEASRLIGRTAEQLSQINEQQQFESVLHSVEYKCFIWKLKAKVFKDFIETKINLNVSDFWTIDPINQSNGLIKTIRRLNNSH